MKGRPPLAIAILVLFLLSVAMSYQLELKAWRATYEEADQPYNDKIVVKLGHVWTNGREDIYGIRIGYGGITNEKYVFAPVEVWSEWRRGFAYAFDLYLPTTDTILDFDPVFILITSATPTEIQFRIEYPYHELPPMEGYWGIYGVFVGCFVLILIMLIWWGNE